MNDFMKLVRKMRHAQKDYFACPNRGGKTGLIKGKQKAGKGG